MIVYAAGVYASGYGPGIGGQYRKLTDERKAALVSQMQGPLSILESYHYMRPQFITKMREIGHKIFLDSGAFSAMSLGTEINIDKYAKYIRDYWDIIDVASVLDAVGDAEATYRNQRTLEDLGCPVLPCFHYGEDLKWLSYYLDHYEHITIGGMVPISNVALQKWLGRIWQSHLSNSDGTARVRVHGFGLTSLDLINRYPWHSIDSTRWIMQGAYGAALHPEFGPQLYITVSDESPQTKRKGGSYHTKPDSEKAKIRAIVESEGFTIEQLQTEAAYRGAFNLVCFQRLEQVLEEVKTVKYLTNELF